MTERPAPIAKRVAVEIGAIALVVVFATLSKAFGWETSRVFWAVWGIVTGVIITVAVHQRVTGPPGSAS